MGNKIWNEGEEWEVSEYNRRLSDKNKEIDKVDKEIRRLKEERDKKIKKFGKDNFININIYGNI